MKKVIGMMVLPLILTACQQKPVEQPAQEQKLPEQAQPVQTEASDKGVGPVQEVKLGPIDKALVAKGKEIFDSKCASCHKFEEKYVGPPLKGVTKRRKPEWIMNMILNPAEMVEKDPIAKGHLAEYPMVMPFQNVTQEEARAILEYLRSVDEK